MSSGSQLGCCEQPKILTARMLTTENQEKHLLLFLHFDLFCSWFWIPAPPFFSVAVVADFIIFHVVQVELAAIGQPVGGVPRVSTGDGCGGTQVHTVVRR